MVFRVVKGNGTPQNPSEFGQTYSVASRRGNKLREKIWCA
jgi:hypothetical protein